MVPAHASSVGGKALTLASGVRIDKLTPQILLAMYVVDRCYLEIGVELVITSANDRQHMDGSLHPKGLAFDCRTEPDGNTWRPGAVKPAAIDGLVRRMRDRLGENFQVILESDHIHVEASPILAPGTH